MEFEFNGIKIDRETWESAPFPIDCSGISDQKMQDIAEQLYYTLCNFCGFDKEDVEEYTKGCLRGDLYEKIDNCRWREEEELIVLNGGIYYEDW